MYWVLNGVVSMLLLLHNTRGHIMGLAVRLPLQGFQAAPGAPWPYPKVWKNSTTVYSLNSEVFQMTGNMMHCGIMSEAVQRYLKLVFFEKNVRVDRRVKQIKSLHIFVEDEICHDLPDENMIESYNLTVSESSTLKAKSIWGALRGLETFSQLVYTDSDNTYYINKTDIIDEPRFGYRGLMLDTARHFIPIPLILKNLDAMSYNKMNVFHWHLVDDQSFPYQSKRFPELSKKGSFSPLHVYSQADIKRVIHYASMRGIRVIPEFDTPGHTASWGKAFPELITPCWANGRPEQAVYGKHGKFELLNPILNTTYKFVRDLYEEIAEVFPDKYIHLGMDEVYHACWESNLNISEFMAEKGFGRDYKTLEQYYVRRVLDIVSSLNSKYVIWQDPIEQGVQAQMDAIVEVWKDSTLGLPGQFKDWQDYMVNITKKGYKTILSACWYLNKIFYGPDWKRFYQCEPLDFNGTAEQHRKVTGGEACMFAEYVDGTNLLSRVWPRASAVAERLWSTRETINVDEAAFRLDQQRCRLLRRGISAEPILNGYCGNYEEGFANDLVDTSHVTISSGSLGSISSVSCLFPVWTFLFCVKYSL